jgi:hypothetical protein
VYNALTLAVKKRIIYELRKFWAMDPVYKGMVKNIQGQYSFRERPCQGMIVKSSGASTMQLSADNFQGTVHSYVNLDKVANFPGLAVEWVTENTVAIQNNRGVFPSPRGIYYIAVEQEEVSIGGQAQERLVFYVDPLLDRVDETPTQLSPLQFQVQNGGFLEGSLRIVELPGNLQLIEDVNYTADPATGIITLVNPLPNNTWLSCDYRYPGTSTGPHLIRENHTNVIAIPGVNLAFGRRIEGGDRLAVIIHDRRQAVALEYGGRWEINFDIDIITGDVNAAMEVSDRTFLYLFGVLRSHLSWEGIEITSVAYGGEVEEIRDDTEDNYFYNGSLTMTLLSDWAIYVPLSAMIRQVSPQTKEQAEEAAGLTDEQLVEQGEPNQVQAVGDLRLTAVRDPFFRGRNRNYEVIK